MPLTEPKWITLEALHLMHSIQVERFGGSAGVRDPGAVESALNRARNRFHYGGSDIDLADLAAAYLYGLAQSQGFVDGNKRTGLAAALAFLDINGRPLHVPGSELYTLTLAVADEKTRWSESQVAAWIRERIEGS
ncbi:MAG TPA: type II toxin-antitoxin system death-on-curing family toxin [Longimicrobiaceae bacterium]|nr:type II toxin-antitoxin system death-on-curing family toxin [Longimicrobiaceae bacterium]